MDNNDVVIVKNFLNQKTKNNIFKFLKKSFFSRKDIRKSGEFKYLQKDYKRLDIGDSYINSRVSRFLLYTGGIKKSKAFNNINKIIDLRNKVINTSKLILSINLKGMIQKL